MLSNDRKMLFSDTLLLRKNAIPKSKYVTLKYNYLLCEEIKWPFFFLFTYRSFCF